MSVDTPKINKLKQLVENTIRERKALLKEGEELDYDALEEELVGAVTKAMMPKSVPITPSPTPLGGDPANKDPNQWRQMPTTEVKPISEDGEGGGDGGDGGFLAAAPQLPTFPPQGIPMDNAQYSGPLLTTKKRPAAPQRLHQLKEALAQAGAEHGSRMQELLEQRNVINAERRGLRMKMREAREAAIGQHMDIYEACARKLQVDTKDKHWKDKVTQRLQESNLL